MKKFLGFSLCVVWVIVLCSACGQKTAGSGDNARVFYDNAGVKVEYTDLSYDGERWWSIGLKVVNDTDNSINFMADGVTVNGYLCGDTSISIDCEANATVERTMEFDNYDILYNVVSGGLTEISKIGIQPVVTVYSGASEKEYIYGEFTEAAVNTVKIPFVKEAKETCSYIKESNVVVFEDENYTVTCLGIAYDFIGAVQDNPYIYFEVTNKTSDVVSIAFDENYESYAEILDSFGAEKMAIVNGEVCEIGDVNRTQVCPQSSLIFAHAIYTDNITADEINEYKKAFKINGYYWYVPEVEEVNECSFAAEVVF